LEAVATSGPSVSTIISNTMKKLILSLMTCAFAFSVMASEGECPSKKPECPSKKSCGDKGKGECPKEKKDEKK
jgi:hypothetical protein